MITAAKDKYPDGSEALLPGPYPIRLAKDQTYTWEIQWIIPMTWNKDEIKNLAIIDFLDQFGIPGIATGPKTSAINFEKPPITAVPTLTPIGIIVMVGLLGIIAISKMRRRGK